MYTKAHWILAAIGIILAGTLCGPCARAQALPLGSVSTVVSASCQTLASQRDFDVNNSTSCFTAQLNCPSADALPFAYAYTPPNPGTALLGTIVIFTGDGGTYASNDGFAMHHVPYYESQGYQVVEVAWGPGMMGTAWEIANSNPNSTTTPSILNAACRPATFLHYVKTVGTIWTSGGMCVHANSGGAAAAAYALTWYGEGADVDKAVLENGPVFSDINRGCEVSCQNGQCTNGQYATVCAPGTTQTGCNGATWPSGNENVFDYLLEFVPRNAGDVNTWTGNTGPACANSS